MDVSFRGFTPPRMRMTAFGDRRGNPAPTRQPGTRTESGRGQRTLARRVGALATAAMLLTAGACGPGSDAPSVSPDSDRGGISASATVTPSPSPSDEVRYPNLSRFTDPVDRFAYKSAYSDCRLIGVEGTAEAFGGDPDTPSSVARAYAVAIFRESEEHREATSQGCLDAFDAEAE
jgi:hypothetical protein